MAREPRLAEVFDKSEDSTVNAQEPVATAAGREEDEDLSQQYYRTPLFDTIRIDAKSLFALKDHLACMSARTPHSSSSPFCDAFVMLEKRTPDRLHNHRNSPEV